MVASGVEQDSLTELLAARRTESEGLRFTVGPISGYVELFGDGFKRQKTSLEKTKTPLETRLAEIESRPDAVLTKLTAQRDRLIDEVNRLSLDRSIVSVKLKMTCCQLSATRAKVGT